MKVDCGHLLKPSPKKSFGKIAQKQVEMVVIGKLTNSHVNGESELSFLINTTGCDQWKNQTPPNS